MGTKAWEADGDILVFKYEPYVKYENTLIATREFHQRAMASCDTVISKYTWSISTRTYGRLTKS